MTLYYYEKESTCFSDKSQRTEAAEELARFYNNVYGKEFYDNKDVPHIVITDAVEKRKMYDYGVRNDYDGKKWARVKSVQSVQSVQSVKNMIIEEIGGFDLKQYVRDACRTECDYGDVHFDVPLNKSNTKSRAVEYIDLLHGIIGLGTEIGELQDSVKRFVFYGKELDVVNVSEEIGDIMWYVAIVCKSLELDLEEVLRKNIDKLRKRYPEKFSEDKALNRDLNAERKILEV